MGVLFFSWMPGSGDALPETLPCLLTYEAFISDLRLRVQANWPSGELNGWVLGRRFWGSDLSLLLDMQSFILLYSPA
ncbi:hypothetical protein VTK56DRAFT_8306 [Thermocarpiscus australiensis]